MPPAKLAALLPVLLSAMGRCFPVAASFALVITGASLCACGLTQYGDTARELIRDKGKKAAATELENVEWALCRATPIGAIRDRYMGSVKWGAYLEICEIPHASIEVPQ